MKKLFIISAILLIALSGFTQNIFVVTKNTDPNPFSDPYNNIDSLCDPDMYGTLQWAVRKANDAISPSRIEFNIPGTGIHEIELQSFLPQIIKPVELDATSQPGYQPGNCAIIINGQGKFKSCFEIYNATVSISGFEITGFVTNAIWLNSSPNSLILNNKVILSSNSSIFSYAIGFAMSDNVTVKGNIISNVQTSDSINSYYGMYIKYSNYGVIGDTTTDGANHISNCVAGILLAQSQNVKISGNSIFNNNTAILLMNGSNNNILPPVILSYANGILSGTAVPNSTIEIFGSTGPENANEYLASCISDSTGNWETYVENTNDYFTTIVTDIHFNTSPMCSAFSKEPSFNCIYSEPCNMVCNPNMFCPDGSCGDQSLPSGWIPSHGTGDWCIGDGSTEENENCYLAPDNPPDEGFIHIWACGGYNPIDYEPGEEPCMHSYPCGEGIIVKLIDEFEPGLSYRFSFFCAKDQIDYLYTKLLNYSSMEEYLENWLGQEYQLPELQNANGVCKPMISQGPSSSSGWDYYYMDFTATDEFLNYDALWIYVYNSSEGVRGEAFIDKVKIEKKSEFSAYSNTTCLRINEPLILGIDEVGVQYQWSSTTGFTSNQQYPVVSMQANQEMAGIYSVTVTTNEGCTITSSIEIFYYEVYVYAGPDMSICPEQSIGLNPSYTSSANAPLFSYEYDWAEDETLNTSGSYPIASPNQTTIYYLTMTTNHGCISTDNVTVYVNPSPPVPNPTNTGPYCSGMTILLQSEPVGDLGQYEYNWNHIGSTWASDWGINNNNYLRENAQNNMFCLGEDVQENLDIDGGTYILQVRNEFGCISIAATDVEVDPQIDGCLLAVNNGPLCYYGDELILNVDADAADNWGSHYLNYNFSWTQTNSSFQASGIPVVISNATPQTSGQYNVLVTSPNGCTGLLHTDVTILENLNLSISFGSPVCEGGELKLLPVPYIEGVTYQWFGPNGYLGSENYAFIPFVTTEMSGTYYYIIENGDDCSFSASINITVDPMPNINYLVTSQAENGSTGVVEIYNSAEQLGFTLSLNNSNNFVFYQNIIQSETTIINNLPAGSYTITISTPNGCKKSEQIMIFGTSPQVVANCNVIPRTCASSQTTIFEITLNGGFPPYSVYVFIDDEILSSDNIFASSGTYQLIFENIPFGSNYFSITVTDSYGYTSQSTCGLSDYAWSFNNVITNGNINNISNYNNMTLCIGDASDQTLNITQNTTFTNCTIYCATYNYSDIIQTLWTVEQGKTLTLNNTKITSGCPDHLWKGIAVEGDNMGPNPPAQGDPGPGSLIVKNNSQIEFASEAIFSSDNGIVKVTDSKFINCPVGIRLANFNQSALSYSVIPNVLTRAYIYRTEFITDENYVELPATHVKLYNVDKINLKGNRYINNAQLGFSSGNGITALNSGFNAIENCHILNAPDVACSQDDKSVFDGLKYGIYAENLYTTPIKVRNCVFNNYRNIGVFIKSATAPVITTNTFSNPVGSGGMAKTAGLYLQGCSAYKIENNTFYDGAIGMVINNSGTYNNTVYRNHFISPLNAFQSYNTNSNADGSEGLFIHCNDYHNNTIQNYIRSGNVKKDQGFLSTNPLVTSISAANQFDASHMSYPNAFRTDPGYTDSFNYKYWYNMPNDVTDINGFTSDNVDASAINVTYNTSQTCPSDLPGLHLEEILSVDGVYDIIMETSSLISTLNNLIDGGNTQVVLQNVQALKPNNFNKTCNDLLEMSPYLSDTVLVTFMRTNVNGHTVAKTNVLLANSPLPENALSELDVMDLPAPHKTLIRQNQDGTNAVVLKKSEISQLAFEKDQMIGSYLRFGLQNDSLMIRKDSIVDFLINDDNFESKCLVIPILVSDKRYNDAQSQINELEYLATNEKPALQAELSEFAALQEVVIKADTAISDGSLTMLVNNNLSFIEALAYNPSHRGCAQAQTLLSIAGITEFEPELFFPVDNRNLRFSTQKFQISENIDMNDLLEIYPNPASKEVWIEYLIFDDNNVSKIEIFDIEGRLVMTQAIRNGYGIEEIDVSNLREGSYILKIGKYSKKLDVMK